MLLFADSLRQARWQERRIDPEAQTFPFASPAFFHALVAVWDALGSHCLSRFRTRVPQSDGSCGNTGCMGRNESCGNPKPQVPLREYSSAGCAADEQNPESLNM